MIWNRHCSTTVGLLWTGCPKTSHEVSCVIYDFALWLMALTEAAEVVWQVSYGLGGAGLEGAFGWSLNCHMQLSHCNRNLGWELALREPYETKEWLNMIEQSEPTEKSRPLRTRVWNGNALNVLDLLSPSVHRLADSFRVGRLAVWQVLSLAYRRLPTRQDKMAREEALDHLWPITPWVASAHQPLFV